MNRLKSMVKSVPALHKLALRTRSMVRRIPGVEPMDGFYSPSPDLLVALVKAFNLQQAQRSHGRDLFDGHAYYEFGLFRGFSFWFAEQISREYAPANFRLLGFDLFQGLPQPQLAEEAQLFDQGDCCGTYEAVTSN